MTTTKKAIVWTKTNSPASRQAVAHLKRMGYEVEERNIVYDNPWNMTKLREAIPGVKSVPQIIIDGTLLGGLKELLAHPDAKLAARALPTFTDSVAAKVARKTVHTEAKAAQAATVQARVAARKAPMQGTSAPTQAERHALVDAVHASRKAQRQAMQPVPSVTPDGKQIAAPSTATPEHVAARHAANVAERSAAKAAALAANATARAEKIATEKARVEAVKQAQRAALVQKG